MPRRVAVLASLLAASCSKSESMPASSEALRAASSATAAPAMSARPKPRSISTVLADARRGGTRRTYVVPTPPELDVYARALRALVADSSGSASHAEVFTLVSIGTDRALVEHSERKVGGAALVLRNTNRLILQVPHSFHDVDTLPIALSLWERGLARALIVNTVHRARGDAPDAADPRFGEADAAHAPRSYFQTAHDVLIHEVAQPIVLQIHGFADATVPGAEVVLSAAGTKADLEPLAAALTKHQVSRRVRVYPRDVRSLGGMTNVQAKLCAARGVAFVHLELSATLRTALMADEARRSRFADAVTAALVHGPAPAGAPGAR